MPVLKPLGSPLIAWNNGQAIPFTASEADGDKPIFKMARVNVFVRVGQPSTLMAIQISFISPIVFKAKRHGMLLFRRDNPQRLHCPSGFAVALFAVFFGIEDNFQEIQGPESQISKKMTVYFQGNTAQTP